jgi:para-aminobenzoate synthetase component I
MVGVSPARLSRDGALAVVGDRLATDLTDVTGDLSALESEGFWAVVLPYSGLPVCARFATVTAARPWRGRRWTGPDRAAWRSSLDRSAYRAGVSSIRASIEAGDVYQVNLTRRMSAPAPPDADVAALGAALAAGNPAPFSAVVCLPGHGVEVASASPERFLSRRGDRLWSSPIKGTASHADGFLAKDRAENVMITDLVRNDLGRVCGWGSVSVPELLVVEPHPGLVHLVTTVEGRLRPGTTWADAIGATFPPGSVTGAPKLAAIDRIEALEPVERGVYCGAVGWVETLATSGAGGRQVQTRGDLNVAIRTFWLDDGQIHFGTGAGITWGSDPDGEWAETELKADRLLGLASAPVVAGCGHG